MVEYKPLIDLPSKYFLYPGLKPGDISVREIIGKDEELMSEINPTNIEKKFYALLCNVVKGIDPKKLTLGDRMYILLWLSINTHGRMFPVELYCQHCFQQTFQEIDLNDFEIKYLSGWQEPNIVQLSDGPVEMRLFTVEDEIKSLDYENTGNNSYLYKYALTIINTQKSVSDLVAWLREMPQKDLKLVKEFHTKNAHGPIMVAKYTCASCGGDGRATVPFRIEMLLR